jgi:hypothetical protein
VIRIGQDQVAVLAQGRQNAHRIRVIDWLAQNRARFGRPDAALTEIEAAANQAMATCLAHGILAEVDIARFAMRVLRFGPGFEQRADHAHVARILTDDTIPGRSKMAAIRRVETGEAVPGG